jgi:RNA-binding protein EWS
MVNKADMGSSLLLVTPLRLDPTARLQVIIANRAAARGSRVHSNRTTPVAWVFMGKSLEDFPDQEKTGA